MWWFMSCKIVSSEYIRMRKPLELVLGFSSWAVQTFKLFICFLFGEKAEGGPGNISVVFLNPVLVFLLFFQGKGRALPLYSSPHTGNGGKKVISCWCSDRWNF